MFSYLGYSFGFSSVLFSALVVGGSSWSNIQFKAVRFLGYLYTGYHVCYSNLQPEALLRLWSSLILFASK